MSNMSSLILIRKKVWIKVANTFLPKLMNLTNRGWIVLAIILQTFISHNLELTKYRKCLLQLLKILQQVLLSLLSGMRPMPKILQLIFFKTLSHLKKFKIPITLLHMENSACLFFLVCANMISAVLNEIWLVQSCLILNVAIDQKPDL